MKNAFFSRAPALERYEAVYGNIEREAGKIGDAALDSFEDLVGTVPTPVAGIRALLSYLSEDVDDLYKEFDDDKLKALLISIDDALQAIHLVV